MAELKTEYGAQATKEDDEIDQMISDATRLIESVYRDINHFSPRAAALQSTPTQTQQQQQQSQQLHATPCTPPRRTTRLNSSATSSPKTPSTRHQVLSPLSRQIEMEVERINRFVETVDHNLRTIDPQAHRRSSQSGGARSRCILLDSQSDVAFVEDVGHTTPEEARGAVIEPMRTPPPAARRRNRITNIVTATPEAIIDLSETQSPMVHPRASAYNNIYALNDDDDDVIIVSANLGDVVDLCMTQPASNVQPATSTTNNSSVSIANRRRMPTPVLQRRGAVVLAGGSGSSSAGDDGGNAGDNGGSAVVGSSSSSSSGFRSRSPQRGARGVEVQTSTTIISELSQLQQQLQNREDLQAQRTTAAATAGSSKVAAAPSSQRTIDGACAGAGGSGGGPERMPFMCPVCMDSTLKNTPTSTKCGHVFCGPCIREAIRMNHKCPMCNTKLKPSMLFRIYL